MRFNPFHTPVLILALASLLPCAGLFFALNASTDGADFTFYTIILDAFSHQLWQGQYYPRWLAQVNAGYGSPAFLYYAPGAFYLSASLEWLRGFDPHGTLRFCISLTLATACGGIAFYCWMKRLLDERTAFFAALLFALFPYKIHMLYVQTALAQHWAIVFAILALIGIFDWLQLGKRSGLFLCSLCLASTLLCHIPSFIVLGFMLPFYAVMQAPRQWLPHLLRLAGALILAIGISAIYWLPLMQNAAFVQSSRFTDALYRFDANFWNHIHDAWMAPYAIILFLAWLHFIRLKLWKSHETALRAFAFSLYAASLLWFMACPFSAPLWHMLPFLPPLQFPFRFYIMLTLILPILVALLPERTRVPATILWPVLLIMHAWVIFAYLPMDDTGKIANIRANKLIVPSEYQTVWKPSALLPVPPAGAADDAYALPPDGILSLKLSEPAIIRIKRYYFYNLIAQDAQSNPLPVTPDALGLASVSLPAGAHRIQFSETPYTGERTGGIITLFSLIILIVAGLAGRADSIAVSRKTV